MTSKVTRFPTKEPDDEPVELARFPDIATVQSMLGDKPLQSILMITINSEGDVSHYLDGVSAVEALGLIEMLKHAIYLSDMGYNDE